MFEIVFLQMRKNKFMDNISNADHL